MRSGSDCTCDRTAIADERQGFLDWLGDWLGVRVAQLPGVTKLRRYDEHTVVELLAVLQASRTKLAQDPTSRSFRDRFSREHSASLERIGPITRAISADEAAADQAVYELYELAREQRARVDAEFERV